MADIVVGIDGSTDAERALRWAVRAGRRCSARVRAVLVWAAAGPFCTRVKPPPATSPEHPRWTAQWMLHDVVNRVREAQPDAWIVERTVYGSPVDTILTESEGAVMLVLGARGRDRPRRLPAGSVSMACVYGASVPVVVVHGRSAEPAESGPVVVGVDGSACSLAALRWAAQEAALRRASLRIMHAWAPLPPECVVRLGLCGARSAGAVPTVGAGAVRAGPAGAAPAGAASAGAGLGDTDPGGTGSIRTDPGETGFAPGFAGRGVRGTASGGTVLDDRPGFGDPGSADAALGGSAFGGSAFGGPAFGGPALDATGSGGTALVDAALEGAARAVLDEAVRVGLPEPGDLDVRTDLIRGAAASSLLRAAAGAQLLVIGARGRGGFAELLLGSISSQCVTHAQCAVAVIRTPGSTTCSD
ncbi:universal stress protein UspA-like protein [Frankia casuarinae]|uniref:UspA n=1 Tax=Frankia casuarinae (strain DSM 45818 / CECT 9043 / HFP020203 / CcI3) TaxID=106370 RepID=Q2JB30_FRACC|nr:MULTISPECIES: universal stress protein [Frankia]ABD11512.1 UspA [Frankia casuarinae]EYT90283.1 universal stress protein UspA-like protein [Frankia casuarinae]KDA41111.1 universal stress protein UspA-like protein [Frankia sp. BMG5.23]ORT46907.1 hypothetical protein KBI5_22665 [Frankia sp. KB5]TFE25439.1 hypothetical protein E0F15_19805 [Frankia sp. B2]